MLKRDALNNVATTTRNAASGIKISWKRKVALAATSAIYNALTAGYRYSVEEGSSEKQAVCDISCMQINGDSEMRQDNLCSEISADPSFMQCNAISVHQSASLDC